MRRTKLNNDKCHRAKRPASTIIAILVVGCFALPSHAEQSGQKTFSSPEEAANALATAAQNNDEKAMLDLLGPDGRQIISSGDETEDARGRANFAHAYGEMHRLVKEPDGTTTLYIGAKNWPTPIPLVRKDNLWYFDTDKGSTEILYRRVGRNEVSAIRICRELVAAEKEYRDAQHGAYASKIISDEGQHNGLYWRVAPGEPQSPIGPLVASAVAEGYGDGRKFDSTPYRGYYFHILMLQGKNGPGGAKSYIVDGKMTGGFGFVAYPAEYRSSGVMTFVVGSDGIVHEKDLGSETRVIATAMTRYGPDSTWQIAEEPQAPLPRHPKTK